MTVQGLLGVSVCRLRRRLHVVGCAAVIAFCAVTVLGQTTAPSKPYTAPRTPWGDPDLQGMWPGNVSAPLQRPANFGERGTLTDDEFAQRQAQARAQAEADSQQFVATGRGGRGGRGGGGIGPPDHWLERGSPIRQTSLIVDPPNGRLPALAAGAEERRKAARGGRGLPGEWRGTADSSDDLTISCLCLTRGRLGLGSDVSYVNVSHAVGGPRCVASHGLLIAH